MGRRPGFNGRDALLDAALVQFSEYGPEAVSLRAISRCAGVAPASVHYHFRTKEKLIDEVLQLFGEEVVQQIVEKSSELVVRSPTARDVVVLVASAYQTLLTKHGERAQRWLRVASWMIQTNDDRAIGSRSRSAIALVCAEAFPDTSIEEVDKALNVAVRILFEKLAHGTTFAEDGLSQVGLAPPLAIDLVINFLSGGLSASLSRAIENG